MGLELLTSILDAGSGNTDSQSTQDISHPEVTTPLGLLGVHLAEIASHPAMSSAKILSSSSLTENEIGVPRVTGESDSDMLRAYREVLLPHLPATLGAE